MIPILITILLILLDQGTKLWALGSLKPIHSMTVVDGFLDLTFVENRGVAFGMLSGQRWLILVLTGVIAGALIYFYRTLPKKKAYLPLARGTFTGAFGARSAILLTAYAAAMWWIFLNSPSLTGLCLMWQIFMLSQGSS